MVARRSQTLLDRWRSIAPVLVVAALVATIIAARDRLGEMQLLLAGPDAGRLLGALAVLSVANLTGAAMFAYLATHHDAKRLIGAYLVSQLAKYVPGRIWVVALQASLVRCMSPTELVLTNLRAVFVVGLAIAGSGVAFLIATRDATLAIVAFVSTWVLCVWVGSEKWLQVLASRMRRFSSSLGDLPTVMPENAAVKRARLLSGSIAGFITCYSLGWWLLVRTVLPQVDALPIVAVLSMSYLIGIASLLPAGIGAREASMVALAPLSGVAPADMAMLALISRSGLVAVDLVLAMAGAWLLGGVRMDVRR